MVDGPTVDRMSGKDVVCGVSSHTLFKILKKNFKKKKKIFFFLR